MGFHYARYHDLAGFWGEVCKLPHRVHREAALLPPTPIADLEKTLNIGPTQRLFRQVSACHQDVEIPAQALHEQVFFVLEFRIQARFAYTCGLFKVRTLVSARPCFQKTGIALSRTSPRVNSFRRPIATLSVNSTARLAHKGPNGPLLQIERLSRRTHGAEA